MEVISRMGEESIGRYPRRPADGDVGAALQVSDYPLRERPCPGTGRRERQVGGQNPLAPLTKGARGGSARATQAETALTKRLAPLTAVSCPAAGTRRAR